MDQVPAALRMRHHHCEAYAGENQKAGESESDGIHNHAMPILVGCFPGLDICSDLELLSKRKDSRYRPEGNHLMVLLSDDMLGTFPSWTKSQPH
jgi:hypothetical protein